MKPRRWFRFSLRTIFVLLTVLGLGLGWLGGQLKWIRDRHRALQWVSAHKTHGIVIGNHLYPPPYRRIDPPWQLRLFGEKGCDQVGVRVGVDEVGRAKELKALFPEAEVHISMGSAEEGIRYID